MQEISNNQDLIEICKNYDIIAVSCCQDFMDLISAGMISAGLNAPLIRNDNTVTNTSNDHLYSVMNYLEFIGSFENNFELQKRLYSLKDKAVFIGSTLSDLASSFSTQSACDLYHKLLQSIPVRVLHVVVDATVADFMKFYGYKHPSDFHAKEAYFDFRIRTDTLIDYANRCDVDYVHLNSVYPAYLDDVN